MPRTNVNPKRKKARAGYMISAEAVGARARASAIYLDSSSAAAVRRPRRHRGPHPDRALSIRSKSHSGKPCTAR